MTTAPSRTELARKRPANEPARQSAQRSNVIEGRFTVRRSVGAQATRFLIGLILACLFAGFVLSMTQQHL